MDEAVRAELVERLTWMKEFRKELTERLGEYQRQRDIDWPQVGSFYKDGHYSPYQAVTRYLEDRHEGVNH